MNRPQLPAPRLAHVYRLEAMLAEPFGLGPVVAGRRWASAPNLDWLNRGVFTSVAAGQTAGVIYDTYLVA